MTDINNLIELLEKANDEFLPITKDHFSLDEHVNDFLKVLCAKLIGMEPYVTCIMPVFVSISSWESWITEGFRELKYLGSTPKESMNLVAGVQEYASFATRTSFTDTVLESKLNSRIVIKISVDEENCRENRIWHDLEQNKKVQSFKVPKKNHRELLCKLKINPPEYPKIEPVSYETRSLDPSEPGHLSEDNVKECFKQFECESSCDVNDVKALATRLVIPVAYHSLYIDDTVDLYYFFSNIVDASKSAAEPDRRSLGGLFVLIDRNITKGVDENEVGRFLALFERLSDKLANRVIHNYQIRAIRNQALTAAVSQIMARNSAHHIGSHIKIRATPDIVRKRICELYTCLDSSTLYTHADVVGWIELMKSRLDWYEVARNEYMAEFRQPPRNMMFYREVVLPFVENPLIMDNIAASEEVRYVPGSYNKLRVRCFIGNSEISCCYPDLQKFGEDQDGDVQYPDLFPYMTKSKLDPRHDLDAAFNNKDICGVSDIEICLPSPHAFYSILENLIRNGAKHNKEALQDGGVLEIYIDIQDKDGDLYQVSIYDNVSALCVEDLTEMHKKKQSSLLEETGQPRRENLGIADMKINAHLLCSFGDVEDSVLKKHLQIILLQHEENADNPRCADSNVFSLEKLESDEDIKRGIECLIEPKKILPMYPANGDAPSRYRFGYQFHLAKSKKVCWIGTECQNTEVKIKLEKEGVCQFGCLKEFTKQFNSQKEKATLAAYQFCILEAEVVSKWNVPNDEGNRKLYDELEELLVNLPFRILINNFSKCRVEQNSILEEFVDQRRIFIASKPIKIQTCDLSSDDIVFPILKSCWINWLKKWIKDGESACLYLHFEDNNEAWENFLTNGEGRIALSEQNQGGANIYFNLLQRTGSIVESNDSEHVVLFDHHAGALARFFPQLNLNKSFYQILEKNSPDYSPIFYPPTDRNNQELLCYELLEAGLCNILVVDERLCASVFGQPADGTFNKIRDAYSGITQFAHLASWAKLYPSNSFEGHSIVQRSPENSQDFICEITTSNDGRSSTLRLDCPDCPREPIEIDALIIHRTYLGKNYCHKESDAEYLKEIRKTIPFVIVISGGGRPHGMQGKFKFRPYNAFQPFFASGVSKYNITRLTL